MNSELESIKLMEDGKLEVKESPEARTWSNSFHPLRSSPVYQIDCINSVEYRVGIFAKKSEECMLRTKGNVREVEQILRLIVSVKGIANALK